MGRAGAADAPISISGRDGGIFVKAALNRSFELLFSYTERSTFERNSSVLMIRLARFGARKQPYYRVVVIEKERARNGRSIEVVGTYNPRTNPASVDLKQDRIDYWTGKGAQLSDRVAKLVAKQPAATAA
jgi:small subunit ribosomal protein S16